MNLRVVLGLAAIACCACNAANAQIVASVGANATGTQTNFEDFESYSPFSFPGQPFTSVGGFDFDLPDGSGSFVIWAPNGVVLLTGQTLYQNSGAFSMTSIRLTSGSDMDELELDIGNGYSANPQTVWIRAYDNGAYTGYEFDFLSIPAGTFTVSNAGTAFDEIRVQAWFDSYVRTPFENQFGAVEIDNITAFTTAVPEPSAIAALSVLGLVGAVVGLRRRKK